jgi:plasmid stabilization system protein ParE
VAYKVVIQKRAEDDLAAAFDFIVQNGAPEAAARWYRNAKSEIESLTLVPAHCTVASESAKLGFEIKQIHFGKRTGIYRILFRVLEDEGEIHVLAVRHGARQEFSADDVESGPAFRLR